MRSVGERVEPLYATDDRGNGEMQPVGPSVVVKHLSEISVAFPGDDPNPAYPSERHLGGRPVSPNSSACRTRTVLGESDHDPLPWCWSCSPRPCFNPCRALSAWRRPTPRSTANLFTVKSPGLSINHWMLCSRIVVMSFLADETGRAVPNLGIQKQPFQAVRLHS